MQPKIQVKVRCNITVSNLGLRVASILLWQLVRTLLNELTLLVYRPVQSTARAIQAPVVMDLF